MELKQSERDLVCVQFPGIVQNDAKALECLGGIDKISEINTASDKKRLGLSFQPGNPFIRNVFADVANSTGILFKIKVKKRKTNNEVKREIVSTVVVGRVTRIFKFNDIFDYQYLPVTCEPGSSKAECILDKILPSGIETLDFFTKEEAPPFIMPGYFSRTGRPFAYQYTNKLYPIKGFAEKKKERTDWSLKNPRYNFSLVGELPSKPHEYHLNSLKERILVSTSTTQDYELVKQKFEERPIWSTNSILFLTSIRRWPLKYIMPCIAIYMNDGPWQKLWVKYGYDPRKEPSARFYQCLDFRLRRSAGVSKLVDNRRRQKAQYHKADRVWHFQSGKHLEQEENIPESSVIFKPGTVVTQRQVYYQYMDIKIPEVEELLSTKPAPGQLCHPTRGWLAPHVPKATRDHLYRYARQALLNSHSKIESLSSGEEQNSDDEDEDSDEDISKSD